MFLPRWTILVVAMLALELPSPPCRGATSASSPGEATVPARAAAASAPRAVAAPDPRVPGGGLTGRAAGDERFRRAPGFAGALPQTPEPEAPAPAATGEAEDALPPLRPPAVPLVTHDPYFSIWSRADRLSDVATTHWTGRRQAITILARIDGRSFRLVGQEPAALPALEQTALEARATTTEARFAGQGVAARLRFVCPLLPDEPALLAAPVTLVHAEIGSTDGREHDVQLASIAAEAAVDDPKQLVTWESLATPTELLNLRAGTTSQRRLERRGDDLRIDWGYVHLATRRRGRETAWAGSAATATANFTAYGALPSTPDARRPRAAGDDDPALALALAFGAVGRDAEAGSFYLGYDDEVSIRYFDAELAGFWRTKHASFAKLLEATAENEESLLAGTAAFDRRFHEKLRVAGGERYARLGALAYRQAIAATKFCADANGRPLAFPKENFSNGCIATVDVIYPAAPLFLWANPELLEAHLVPVLAYAASERWKFPFAPHDLGTYPHATGQVYGGGERSDRHQMPVEESANLILLVAALAKRDGTPAFAREYRPLLERWAHYLREKGLDPENQLCTDDFTGHLAHNVNLSAKAILALAAWAQLLAAQGEADAAREFRTLAESFAKEWMQKADDGDHTRLAFDRPGSWSQKYNLVWDRVLGLGVFPPEVAARDVAWYRKIQGPFGVPLDNRATFTKLDWITWSACLTGSLDDFRALTDPVYRFLHESRSRVPMGDWYQTADGAIVTMIARPVVGGVFMRMLDPTVAPPPPRTRSAGMTLPFAPLPLRRYRIVVPTSEDAAQSWRFTESRPPGNWAAPSFDDAAWTEGPGGFGTPDTPGAVVRTRWASPGLWLRRTITIPEGEPGPFALRLHHDEAVRIHVDGTLILERSGYTTDYGIVPLPASAMPLLAKGRHLLAVSVEQTGGGQFFDLGIVAPESELPGRK